MGGVPGELKVEAMSYKVIQYSEFVPGVTPAGTFCMAKYVSPPCKRNLPAEYVLVELQVSSSKEDVSSAMLGWAKGKHASRVTTMKIGNGNLILEELVE